MDWLNQHIELIGYVAGAVLTFTVWNVNQGRRIGEVDERHSAALAAYKELMAERVENQARELAAVKAQMDGVQGRLADELKSISMKLAHIEGFLTAQKFATDPHAPK